MSRGTSRLSKQASAAVAVAVGVASGAAAPAVAQGLPQHMVAYMTGAGQTQCPDNWTEAAYAQGRLILGTTDGSKIQKLAGTPAGDAQPPQHAHAFKVTGAVDTIDGIPSAPTGGNQRAAGGGATNTGTTQEARTSLPFIQFLVCEHTAAESPDSAPYGTVAFFNASTCPANWTALDQADGRFLLPALAGATPGYATETVWDPLNPPTHTHGLQASFKTQSAEYRDYEQHFADFASPGTYALAGTTASGEPVLPFVSLLVCEKDAIGNSEGIPPGTMVFFGAEDCPDGWGITIGADGRFFVGIGGNGTQGATFGSDPIGQGETSIQHDHQFSGLLWLGQAPPGMPESPNFDSLSYVMPGANPYFGYGYSGTSGPATTELPYLVLQACTYTADQAPQGAGRPGSQ